MPGTACAGGGFGRPGAPLGSEDQRCSVEHAGAVRRRARRPSSSRASSARGTPRSAGISKAGPGEGSDFRNSRASPRSTGSGPARTASEVVAWCWYRGRRGLAAAAAISARMRVHGGTDRVTSASPERVDLATILDLSVVDELTACAYHSQTVGQGRSRPGRVSTAWEIVVLEECAASGGRPNDPILDGLDIARGPNAGGSRRRRRRREVSDGLVEGWPADRPRCVGVRAAEHLEHGLARVRDAALDAETHVGDRSVHPVTKPRCARGIR